MPQPMAGDRIGMPAENMNNVAPGYSGLIDNIAQRMKLAKALDSLGRSTVAGHHPQADHCWRRLSPATAQARIGTASEWHGHWERSTRPYSANASVQASDLLWSLGALDRSSEIPMHHFKTYHAEGTRRKLIKSGWLEQVKTMEMQLTAAARDGDRPSSRLSGAHRPRQPT